MDQRDEEEQETPKLRVKRDDPAGDVPTIPCPKCGAAGPEDAVICVQCGYDFRSGAVHKTSTGISHTVLVMIAVVVSVIVASIAILVLMNIFRSEPTATEPVVSTTQPPPAEFIEPEPTRVAAVESEVEPEPAPIQPALEPAQAVTAPEPAVKEDPREREAEMRRVLREALDERLPPHIIGDTVELRRLNGFVHRGELVAIRDGVALVVDGDLRERVPLQELDRDSRMLVDQEFRDRMVESRLRAMLKGLE